MGVKKLTAKFLCEIPVEQIVIAAPFPLVVSSRVIHTNLCDKADQPAH
jgi:hypothetical protein